MESLGEHVPAETDMNTFNVRYLKTPLQAKHRLITDRDLKINQAKRFRYGVIIDDAVPPTSTIPGPALPQNLRYLIAKRVQKSTKYCR